MIIYRHTNTINGHAYIGVTSKSLLARFQEHCSAARRGSSFAFHCAIRKYGENCWIHEKVIETETPEEAARLEQSFILSEQTMIPKGYNMTAGGDGFIKFERTEIHRKRISNALTGKAKSPEHRAKLSAYKGEKASFYGRKQSQEWCNKMCEVRKRIVQSKGAERSDSREYIVVLPNEIIVEIKGLAAFCRKYNLTTSDASYSLRTGRPTKGFIFHRKHLEAAE